MSGFSYELPEENGFFDAVLTVLKLDPKYNQNNYYNILKNGYCEISATSSYSQKRWDAMYTIVNFYIPQDKFGESASILDDIKTTLRKICAVVMPPNAGYDVMEVNISPDLNIGQSDILREITTATDHTNLSILSDDIKQKGKDMSELYVTLYCIENLPRNFIDTILSNALGDMYFSKITVPSDVTKGIAVRKKEESQNKWLPFRGDKDIYYLDFIDLSKLILNNWEHFKSYFPSQGWISTKIEELYKVRCLIAHNSYAGDDEKTLVALYFKQIVKQLGTRS